MLLRKLVEAEFDGVAVVTQLTALNESMGGVKKVNLIQMTLLNIKYGLKFFIFLRLSFLLARISGCPRRTLPCLVGSKSC